MKKILIVEDDLTLNQMLNFHLQKHNYSVCSACTYEDAYREILSDSYELIILDVNLNNTDGFHLCPVIKTETHSAVVFLTARDLEADILHGYDLGADDYVTKPFSIEIFLKKIEAIMQRLKSQQINNIYCDGYLTLNFSSFTASVDHREIALTPLEFKILKLLFENADQIIMRQALLERLWDSERNFVDESALNVAISRIRKKIESDSHKYIKTIYGTGYRWMGDNSHEK